MRHSGVGLSLSLDSISVRKCRSCVAVVIGYVCYRCGLILLVCEDVEVCAHWRRD